MNLSNYMSSFFRSSYLFFALIAFSLSGQLAFADEVVNLSESDFVGSWYSSHAITVIDLNSDGTWEISEWDQSGWWAIDSDKFVWMYEERDLESAEDINQILSYAKNEFKLRESDDSETVFTRQK